MAIIFDKNGCFTFDLGPSNVTQSIINFDKFLPSLLKFADSLLTNLVAPCFTKFLKMFIRLNFSSNGVNGGHGDEHDRRYFCKFCFTGRWLQWCLFQQLGFAVRILSSADAKIY